MNDAERIVKLASQAALLVEDGMCVGLGSGSTAEAVIDALGRRVKSGLRVCGVATSERTAKKAREAGVPLTTLGEFPRLDIGIDGADEIDPDLNLIKGRGGALLYEKIVALACDQWIIVAASEKLVDTLGSRIRLPVEIVSFGREQTEQFVRQTGIEPALRLNATGDPFKTDAGHYILDCMTGQIDDPMALAADLKEITGVVEHGLFIGMAGSALTIDSTGVISTHRPGDRGAPVGAP